MNGWSQVITEVEFNCMAATQGAHHVIILFCQHCRLEKEGLVNLTALLFGVYWIRTWFLLATRRCVTNYSTDSPHTVTGPTKLMLIMMFISEYQHLVLRTS